VVSASKMLSTVIFFQHFFTTPPHLVHGVYYALRYFFTQDTKPKIVFDVAGKIPSRWTDLLFLPVITLALTLPDNATSDFAFIPYFIHHAMGYQSPVWFTVLIGAFFTTYITIKPTCLLVCIAAFLSHYLTGERRKHAVGIAAACHLLFGLVLTEWHGFTLLGTLLQIAAAECKLRMNYNYELFPPVEHAGILAIPAYVANFFIGDWYKKWRYTDFVANPDVAFMIGNITMAIGLYFMKV